MAWPFLWIILSLSALADTTIHSGIYDIDYDPNGEVDLLLLTNGQVIRIPQGPLKWRGLIEDAKSHDLKLEFKIGEQRELLDISPSDQASRVELPFTEIKSFFEPTVLSGAERARELFQAGRYKSRDSQCYNRAHVWSFEWFRDHQINSQKTWLFFTRKYIRKFAFEWWFHVAPSVIVEEESVRRHRVMDLKYAKGPLETKRWTDIFMRNDANCPIVETYSDYANYPETGWCYLMRTSMFYYQPIDIERLETWGASRGNWHGPELTQAFQDALEETF